jgi:pyrroline-5-carboxylate reductase
MIKKKKITVIGPGVMGKAILSRLTGPAEVPPKNITISGPNAERTEALEKEYGVSGKQDNGEAVTGAELVILAIKPQRFEQVAKSIAKAIRKDALVISIIAGVSIERIRKAVGVEQIIRAMPNTPAQIGLGITLWVKSKNVNEEQKQIACEILQALGEEVFVEDESYMDMATALSGTGPAYVFLFMEAMIDAGVHLGFPRRIAEKLVVQTLRGSAEFYIQNHEHPARLRNEVTSPGGTSAAALYYLEKAGFRTAISRAIWAAYERSIELGVNLQPNNSEPENGTK